MQNFASGIRSLNMSELFQYFLRKELPMFRDFHFPTEIALEKSVLFISIGGDQNMYLRSIFHSVSDRLISILFTIAANSVGKSKYTYLYLISYIHIYNFLFSLICQYEQQNCVCLMMACLLVTTHFDRM